MAALSADAILGLWATEKGQAHVEIYRENDRYYGRIVWLKEPYYPTSDAQTRQPRRDRENPDKKLRARSMDGLVILKDFVFDKTDAQWENGTVYDPEAGETYSGKIWLTDTGTLKLRRYVGFALLGRTGEWLPVVGAGDVSTDNEANNEESKE